MSRREPALWPFVVPAGFCLGFGIVGGVWWLTALGVATTLFLWGYEFNRLHRKELRETLSWLRDLIRNPDVVFVDPQTGEEASRERWKRADRFHILRPIWTHYFLTTGSGCGCRKRLGLWHTMWCSKHCFPELEDPE